MARSTHTIRLSRPVRSVRSHECRLTVVEMPSETVPEEPVFQIEQLLAPLERIADDVQELRALQRNSLRELQELAVELSVAVASRVVRAAIDQDHHDVNRLVTEVIETLQPDDELTIHLHPQDLEMVTEAARHHGVLGHSVRFRGQEDMARGECRAEAKDICLATSVTEQLTQIRLRLLQNLEDAETERRQNKGSTAGLQRFPDRRATG